MLFVFQGFRTLEDIRTKANLSNTQKIGLKHYDDLLDRMPREEAAAIEKVVMHFSFVAISSCIMSVMTTEICVHYFRYYIFIYITMCLFKRIHLRYL